MSKTTDTSAENSIALPAKESVAEVVDVKALMAAKNPSLKSASIIIALKSGGYAAWLYVPPHLLSKDHVMAAYGVENVDHRLTNDGKCMNLYIRHTGNTTLLKCYNKPANRDYCIHYISGEPDIVIDFCLTTDALFAKDSALRGAVDKLLWRSSDKQNQDGMSKWEQNMVDTHGLDGAAAIKVTAQIKGEARVFADKLVINMTEAIKELERAAVTATRVIADIRDQQRKVTKLFPGETVGGISTAASASSSTRPTTDEEEQEGLMALSSSDESDGKGRCRHM